MQLHLTPSRTHRRRRARGLRCQLRLARVPAVMGGEARLAWHGIDRVRHGSSTLLPKGGRINLTLRVVAG